MTTITRGSDKIRNIERALGGTPPKAAIEKSRAALQQHTSERFKAQKRAREEIARLAEPLRSLMLGHVAKDDPKLKKSIADTRAAYELRNKHKLKSPKAEKFEPSLSVGSISLIKAPPYDAQWSFKQAAFTDARADSSAGTYHLGVQSIGDGSLEVAAGVGIWFFAPATDAQQRFAVVMDYSDDWWDSAAAYVAHNNLRTRLWVWGHSENAWVSKADSNPPAPAWSDGVGWYEDHGNQPGDWGRISAETKFYARANNWYLGWVWSDASVYADSGFWGFAASSIHFDASVPLVVFGSL